jgi:hypothetical protein
MPGQWPIVPDPVLLPAAEPANPPPPPIESALGEETLGRLLGALASRPGPVPKYLYPSAGTLYPVQAYVVLRQSIGSLMPGSYYHDPVAHALVPVSSKLPAAQGAADVSVLLVLVAQRAAIEPIYPEEAETFCLLEAGYMIEALRRSSPGLVLRDLGDPVEGESAALKTALRLDPSHRLLACLAVEEPGR